MRFVGLGLLGIVLVAGLARADSGWVLTTADFNQRPVALQAIDGTGVQATAMGQGGPVTVPFDQFLQVERSSGLAAAQGKFTLILLSGDRLMGDPTGYENEHVVWRSQLLGQLKLSLKSIRGMVRQGKMPDGVDRNRTEDIILLSNGDRASGIVIDVNETRVKISSASGDLDVPLDAIDAILFASAGRPPAGAGPTFRLRLGDGSTFTALSVRVQGDRVSLGLSDKTSRELPLSAVGGIEQLNGPVSWLSSRAPDQAIQVPFFGSSSWPTRMDQTVSGKPIEFAGRRFFRGIGVHAYSRLDYALDGRYEVFRTQYAIATDLRREFADVTVCIKLDGRVVHEQKDFRAGTLAPVVMIDLPKSAKVLTLEVDFGAANDTQDHFNWIEPALLRDKPAPALPNTRPATQPKP